MTIIDSDAFLEMPMSARCLYYDLGMRADDDGFINNPRKIQRMIGASDDDLKLLMAKNFIIPFDSGVVVIKHWKIHNYIRNDRYKPTVYKEELVKLEVKENKSYTLKKDTKESLDTIGIPNGYQMETQVRLGKDSIGKDNKDINVSFTNETVEYQLSNLLYQSILKNDEKFKMPNLSSWADHIDRLMRIDNRSPDEIKSVIGFATTNDFWKSNILSTKKLRDKFATLVIQMKRGEPNGISQKPSEPNKPKYNIQSTKL